MIDPAAINRLLNVTTIEELWDIHTRSMAGFGFDRLLYGCTRFRTATSLGDGRFGTTVHVPGPFWIRGRGATISPPRSGECWLSTKAMT
jgi:hypothetical protein